MSDYMGDYEEQKSCSVNSLLLQLPKDVRGIGEEVLHAIACGKKLLSWNKKLQLVINNRAIPNTNIVELVEYILYPEGDDGADPPNGFEIFIEELKRIGLESQWVRNESVIKSLDDNENDWNTTDSESSDEEHAERESSSGTESDSEMNDDDKVDDDDNISDELGEGKKERIVMNWSNN